MKGDWFIYIYIYKVFSIRLQIDRSIRGSLYIILERREELYFGVVENCVGAGDVAADVLND